MNDKEAEDGKKNNLTSEEDPGTFATILTFLIVLVYLQIGMKVIVVFIVSLAIGMLVNWGYRNRGKIEGDG